MRAIVSPLEDRKKMGGVALPLGDECYAHDDTHAAHRKVRPSLGFEPLTID